MHGHPRCILKQRHIPDAAAWNSSLKSDLPLAREDRRRRNLKVLLNYQAYTVMLSGRSFSLPPVRARLAIDARYGVTQIKTWLSIDCTVTNLCYLVSGTEDAMRREPSWMWSLSTQEPAMCYHRSHHWTTVGTRPNRSVTSRTHGLEKTSRGLCTEIWTTR